MIDLPEQADLCKARSIAILGTIPNSLSLTIKQTKYMSSMRVCWLGHTGVCEVNAPPEEEDPREEKPEKYQIGGWIGVSAVELQCKCSNKRNVFFADTGRATVNYPAWRSPDVVNS